MRKVSTRTSRKTFENALATAFRIYGPIRPNCVWSYESINEATFHPNVALKIVGLSFLLMVSAWEEYLENTFLEYMSGAKSESSFSPILRIGCCKNTTHAMQILAGTTHFNDAVRLMKWNDFDWVLSKSNIFFKGGKPYSKISQSFQQRLKDASVIRNRVAHFSYKAKQQFKKIVNANIGVNNDTPLDRGFSPGRYLVYQHPEIIFDKDWIDTKELSWGDIFECYLYMFFDLMELITPST